MSNFDFNKAINGEPIYCNGTQVYPIYDIFNKKFLYLDDNWDNEGNGRSYPFPHKLTTDPPKKKVKKTVNVFVHRINSRVLDASFDKKPLLCADWDLLFTHEIEVEE